MQTIGVNVIKFDEPAFNLFLSDVFEWGIETLNRTIDGVICTKAAHICYGYGIQENLDWKETLGIEWHQYKKISPTLNASRIQQVSLECANLNVPILLIGLLLRQDNPGRSD